MGALHMVAHLAQWRARRASLLDGHAVSVPAAVLPIDKGLRHRAFGAESSFSSPISHGTRALNKPGTRTPRFFPAKLTKTFAFSPCPSLTSTWIAFYLPGLDSRYAFSDHELYLLNHRRSTTCRSGQSFDHGCSRRPTSHGYARPSSRLSNPR